MNEPKLIEKMKPRFTIVGLKGWFTFMSDSIRGNKQPSAEYLNKMNEISETSKRIEDHYKSQSNE